MPTKKDLSEKKRQALSEYKSNNLAGARVLYMEICRRDKADADAWHMLSGINGLLGLFEESEACARKVIKLHPDFAGGHKNLGSALVMQGRVEEAKKSFRRALGISPDDAESYSNLGSVCAKQKNFEEAVEYCRKAITVKADYAEAHNNLGNALLGLHQPDEALTCFRRALQIKPDYFDAYFNMGKALQELGRFDHALTCYQQLLEVRPGYIEIQLAIASILHEQTRLDEANKVYSQILDNNPEDPRAVIGITSVLLKQRKYDDALQYMRPAHDKNPDNTDFQYCLGLVYNKAGDTDKAASCFRKVLKLDPDHVQASHFLAMMGGVVAPERADARYVASLFDGYANTFDQHLVTQLGYKTPEHLKQALNDISGLHMDMDILDLGCGTGLCGPLFCEYAHALVGVDLSPKMINKARERGVYDELIVGDLVLPLDRAGATFDLIIAADVFVYIGDLNEVFDKVAASLKPGGIFAFSVESTDREPYLLHSEGRYAHSAAYIRSLAGKCGMKSQVENSVVLRVNEGKAVYGNIILLGRGE